MTLWRVAMPSSTSRMKISALAWSGITLGARPPEMVPMFRVLAPEDGVLGELDLAQALQGIEKLLDGGLAQLRIGRVRHAAVGDDFVAQRAFRAERQLVLGGLAVDEEPRAARRFRGSVCAGAVALLADHEEQPEIADARGRAAPRAALIIAAMMPLVSQAPRPQM